MVVFKVKYGEDWVINDFMEVVYIFVYFWKVVVEVVGDVGEIFEGLEKVWVVVIGKIFDVLEGMVIM